MTTRYVRSNVIALKIYSVLDALYPMSILGVVWCYEITGSYALAAMMFSISIAAQGILELPCGVISDKLGRVKNMRLSAAMFMIANTMTAAAGYGAGLPLLITGALLIGLAGALVSGTREAFVHENLKDAGLQSKFDIVYSRVRMWEQAGAMCGAGIAAAVMFIADLQTLAWSAVGISALFFASSFLLHEPQTAPKVRTESLHHIWTAMKHIWADKKLRGLVGIKMLDGSGSYYIEGAYFATLIPAPLVPLARLFRHLTGVVGFYISAFVRRIGFLKILIFSSVGSMVAKIIGVGLNNVATPFINSSTNLFFGLNETAYNSLMQQGFTDKQRATMGNVVSLVASISEGAMIFAYGLIADLTSMRGALVAAIITDLIVVILYRRMFKKFA